MQARGADAKHDRVSIGAAYSTLYTLESFGLVQHDRSNPEMWWLTEKGKKVHP